MRLAAHALCLAGFVMLAGHALATNKKDLLIKTQVVSRKLPFSVKYEVSRTVGSGRILKVRNGEDGQISKTYRLTYEGDNLLSRELVDTVKTPAVDALFKVGAAGFAANRGSYNRSKVMRMKASAYDPSAGRGKHATFRTATGRRAQYGVVAVDPRVIPLGTILFVEGYGLAIAADTGGAIKGSRIDLCYGTRRQALNFGRKSVKVHVLRR